MEKQSLHRFTTGILTQQETEKKSKIVKQKGKKGGVGVGSLGPLMMGGKREKERRSDKRPGAGEVVYMQTESCVTGDREGGGGTEEREGRGGRWRKN